MVCSSGNGCNILGHQPCLSVVKQWIKVNRGRSACPCCYRTVTGGVRSL